MLELEKLLRWCQDAFSLPGKQTEVQGSELNCPRSETGSEPEPVLSRPDPGSFILLLITTSRLSWTLKAPILIYEHPKGFLLTITSTQWASLSSAFWVLAYLITVRGPAGWMSLRAAVRLPRVRGRGSGTQLPVLTQRQRRTNQVRGINNLTLVFTVFMDCLI